MCNAVVSSITNSYSSDKIEENNCSDETSPNIIMTDSNIESITELHLGDSNISNISGIEYFTSLTSLRLYSNQITDITPLKDLTSLTELDLYSNQITDLTLLSGLANLKYLDLSGNPINDIDSTLLLDLNQPPVGERANISTAITNNKEYNLPSLFLFWNAALDIKPEYSAWVSKFQSQVRQIIDMGLIKFDLQNAKMNEDGKGITF